MEKKAVWQEQVQVKSYEADADGNLRLHVLFHYFQEIAGNHAASLTVPYEELKRLGLFWVLARIKVGVVRMPRWRDVALLSTWPKGVDGLLALRDFRMTDEQGHPLVVATSAWLLLDTARYRPQRMSMLPYDWPLNEHDHALGERLEKLKLPEGLPERFEKKVMQTDLDVNQHVNNAEYVRWIIDSLDAHGPGSLKTLQVNYLEEAVLGDAIVVRSGGEGSASWYSEGVSRSKGTAVFQAKAEWAAAGTTAASLDPER